MCLHLLVPVDKVYTMNKLSQWTRTLRQAMDASQVLTAAVIEKSSLKLIERDKGTSWSARDP